jgi:TolB-like protein
MNITSQGAEAHNQSLVTTPISDKWTHDEVRDELTRILRSRFFVKSTRLSCFLSTAIDYLLAGKADCFKEYTVGTEVYRRSATYDPTQDTIVRTEARRLRAKLKDYYSDFPNQHRLRITLVTGSYVPVIETGYVSQYDDGFGLVPQTMLPVNGYRSVAVISFNARAVEPTNQDLASTLEERLTHELAQNPDLKVFRAAGDGAVASQNLLGHWSRCGVQFALRGYVHQSAEGPVAQIQLTTILGMILWSARFSGRSLQGQSNEIASAVCTAFLGSSPVRPGCGYDAPRFDH